ncbi:MAG TPA: DUF3667 domain-containing protein [Xanthomonadales bacterium]|nr:DUF3667 domain-containing protein [Xanthomonadales bacterium]
MSETAAAIDAAAPEKPRPDGSPASAPGDRCPNCLAPLKGPYCYDCGQSKKGLIRHFSSILGDFLDSVLNFDTRTWRTIPALYFRPGYLSNEYFAGRRVRYVTPLRLYFFLSVVAFLVISFVTPEIKPGEDGQVVGISEESTPEQQQERLAALDRQLAFMPEAERAKIRADVEKELASRKAAKEAQAAATKEQQKADRVANAVKDAEEAEQPMRVQFGGDKDWDEKTNPLVFSWLSDGMNQAMNAEIGEILRKAKGINKDPGPFVKQLYSTAPQALFVILPVFALLLKVFYLFKRRLYMEHLIVALHSHSFICLSLLVGIGLSYALGASREIGVLRALFGFLIACVWIWVPVYLFLMQKRVYRQGWIMTTLKFGMIGFCYLWLLTIGMLATIVVSLIVL